MARGKNITTHTKQIQKQSKDTKTSGKRKQKNCTRCRLHNVQQPDTKAHSKICPYLSCRNFLCHLLTTYKQLTMKSQLGIWRDRSKYIPANKQNNDQLCDKCRNHLVRNKKKGHEKHCLFSSCQGLLCRFSHARRKIMSLFLKIKRSNILCEVFEYHYKKYSAAQEKNPASPSIEKSPNKRRIIKPTCIKASIFPRQHPIVQEYPQKHPYPMEYTSQFQIDPYHATGNGYYPQFQTHASCVWSRATPYSEDSYAPRVKVTIQNYNTPTSFVINYDQVSHDAETKRLFCPGLNTASNQSNSKNLYRPWL